MIVYKFGGASVNSPEGVRNLAYIINHVEASQMPLLVIVSAMGKTTNALEEVLREMVQGDAEGAIERFARVEEYHNAIIEGLMGSGARVAKVEEFYEEVRGLIQTWCGHKKEDTPIEEQDRLYDEVVSYGELISTAIISHYLQIVGIDNRWIDMRRCIITDARHREADVIMEPSTERLTRIVDRSPHSIFIGQGFIGGTIEGETTTLGREGSDYSAAIAANILDASQATIWKDVPGVLNADPRIFDDTLLIPELTYLDAVELAYSGAQIIHPKTIKPLQNKQIPLFVRPFADPSAKGSTVSGQMEGTIDVPILILKPGQVLISIRPKDFSFVLEDKLMDILSLLDSHGIKINLIQTSAVNLSLCVDETGKLDKAVSLLHEKFRVVYNDNMELLTIRGYTPQLYAQHAECEGVFLSQRTRRIVRIVRKANK